MQVVMVAMVMWVHFNLGIVIIMIKNKEIKKLLLFVLFAFCSFMQADEVQQVPKKIESINRELVDSHKIKISEKITRNKYERIGILCASTAVIAALGWYALSDSELVPADQALTQNSNQKIDALYRNSENMQKYAAIIAAHASKSNTIKPDIKPTSKLRQWCSGVLSYSKKMGQMAVDNSVLMVFMAAVQVGPIKNLFIHWGNKVNEIGEYVYYDVDFHWFVTKQTQAIAYFNDLERSAELLPLACDAEEREYQRDSMMWAGDMLVKQLARVVAFMEYQAQELKVLNTGCSIQMQASSKYVYRHVEQFSTTLQTMLDDHTKHAEIPAYIKSFRKRLRSEQDSFCVNEYAALYDISDSVA